MSKYRTTTATLLLRTVDRTFVPCFVNGCFAKNLPAIDHNHLLTLAKKRLVLLSSPEAVG